MKLLHAVRLAAVAASLFFYDASARSLKLSLHPAAFGTAQDAASIQSEDRMFSSGKKLLPTETIRQRLIDEGKRLPSPAMMQHLEEHFFKDKMLKEILKHPEVLSHYNDVFGTLNEIPLSTVLLFKFDAGQIKTIIEGAKRNKNVEYLLNFLKQRITDSS
ncbi:hypothetical protein PsorP6_010519 [Peronosclerospora sorghi]|uniref:Uncharacterized protein n=1 Tax=Peronosclerospora sorghi TaxID=230839 RepID=A0ACC0VUQ0_9STRA|nr:hypothetical protein PsorP6_010519 [Peronosclerospora sorghi]